MSRPRRFEIPGAIYHVTARGNGRRDVFLSTDEKEVYLDLLGKVGAAAGWTLLAYCLMTNHVHLLLRLGEISLGRTMNRLQGTFVRRVNRRSGRTGRRFGDRYRSWFVRDERHALAASCYIHRNPVSAGIVDRAERYDWSSLRAYLGGPRIAGVRPDEVIDWAGGPAAYADLVAAPPPEPPAMRWKGVPVLGGPGPHLARIEERRAERPGSVGTWDDVVGAVARVLGYRLDGPGFHAAWFRTAVLMTGADFGLPLRGAAARLGYAAGSPSTIVARGRARARRDPDLARLLLAVREEVMGSLRAALFAPRRRAA